MAADNLMDTKMKIYEEEEEASANQQISDHD